MAEPDPSVPAADEVLDGLVAALRAAHPRAAHRGRLDQIAQLAASLKSLIGELPAESEREADYEARLLADHDAGRFNPDESTHRHNYPAEATERLRDALARRKAG